MQKSTKTKAPKKPKHIVVIHIGGKENIKVSQPTTTVAKIHKNTIRNGRGAIRQLRKEKRQAITQAKRDARQEFKLRKAPHVHTIKMAKLLLKQVRTTEKLTKLNDK